MNGSLSSAFWEGKDVDEEGGGREGRGRPIGGAVVLSDLAAAAAHAFSGCGWFNMCGPLPLHVSSFYAANFKSTLLVQLTFG